MAFSSLLFSQLVAQAPGLLVFLAGIVAAIVLYRRAPTAAQLVIAGCAVSVASRVLGTVALAWIRTNAEASGRSVIDVAPALSYTGLGSALMGAVGLGLLIAAAVAGRPPAAG